MMWRMWISLSLWLAVAGMAHASCENDDSGLKLPAGFCATVFADGLGHVRHIAVAPNGVVYANSWSGFYYGNDTPPAGGFLIALQDKSGKGKAEAIERFGETVQTGGAGGSGIAVYNNYLYAEDRDRIVRYRLPERSLVPEGEPEVVVSGLPLGGDHPMHPFGIGADGMIYVDVASITNACQSRNRQARSAGLTPCTELEARAGIWRFDADKLNQKFSPAERFASGIRNAGGIAIDAKGAIFATQHGRDQLSQNWPELYTAEQNAILPAEELLHIEKGGVYGWPECYFDPMQGKLVLAPEYGGDGGRKVGVCADKRQPVAAFPAHWAPNALMFYQGKSFPTRYREGAFIAFHGSWNRAPMQQAGYNVAFQPLKDGKVSGRCEIFADGFAGAVKAPDKAQHRPAGLAYAPDGALYISDDVSGRIYRVVYQGGANLPQSQVTYCPDPSEYARPPESGQAPAAEDPGLPVPPGATREMVAQGHKLYQAQGAATTCIGCHGSDGTGTALGPDLTDKKVLWGDGSFASIRKIIAEGVTNPRNYRSPMPAMGGSQLTNEQVRALAAYTWALSHQSEKGEQPRGDLAIPGGKTFPESITSLADGSIIVGSLGEGPIYMAGPDDSSAGYFIAPGTDGLQRILGVLAEESSNTLWVCSIPAPNAKQPPPSSLFAFDLKTGRSRAHYPLPTAGGICNDIATGPDGEVYATDTVNMEILRLPRGGSKLQVWAGNGAFGPKGGILDGIAVVGRSVLVNTLETNKLFRVQMNTDGGAGKISEVNVGRALQGPDGMRSFGENSVLLVESGGPGRLVRVDLEGDTGKLTTLREGFPGGPVSVTVVGDTAYVLEGQLALRHQRSSDAKPQPFKAIAVPLNKPQDDRKARVLTLIDELSKGTHPKGTPEQRIADMHASFMDTARIDQLGLEPMREDLQKIARARSKKDIAALYGQGNFIYAPFRVDVSPDPTRADAYAAAISQSGLDMHDKEPYVAMDPKAVEVREKFVVFLARMLDLMDSRNSRARAEKILELETAIAKASRPETQEQDESSQTRTWTQEEIIAQAPAFDWAAYLRSNGISPSVKLLIGQPDVIRDVARVIADTDLAVLKDHLTFSIICTWGWHGALPQPVFDLQFDFYGRVRRGATQQPDRQTRAFNFLDRTLRADLNALLKMDGAAVRQDGPEILRDDVYGNARRAHFWNWERQRVRLK